MKKCGAEIVVQSLVKEGVEVMFGFPGGMVIDIFHYLNQSPIKFYLVRHEQGAAHAADGYARSSGKVGVCIATSGPGATNLVTGIATAYMDSIPMVAITGQVPTTMIGNDAFQEADIIGITRSITKHSYLVKRVEDIPRIIKEAFHIASTGRPGPVLIDVPKDIQKTFTTEYEYPTEVNIRGYKPNYEGNINQIKKAAKAIEEAEKPILYIGGGVIASGAHNEVLQLAEKCDLPVTSTLLGLGGFPDTHPLSLKMLGMHGTQYANYAVDEADLIIAVGARFDDRVTGKLSVFAPNVKNIIHIDIDPSSISKSIVVNIPVVGDCKNILEKLLDEVKPKKHTEWVKKIEQWKKEYPLIYKDDGKYIKPQYVIEQIDKVTKGDAIIVTEVGQHQMWAAHYFKYTKPRTFLSSGGLGTMGFGFPAAIGAQTANPDKLVFDIAGDGSIQMNIQELATATINKLPVKIVILNNGFLGMVRQWQELFYEQNYAYTCLQPGNASACNRECTVCNNAQFQYIPDFVKLAESYNALGIRVEKKEDVIPALKKAIETPNTVVLDFIVDPCENVYPMIPAGASVKQMIGGMA